MNAFEQDAKVVTEFLYQLCLLECGAAQGTSIIRSASFERESMTVIFELGQRLQVETGTELSNWIPDWVTLVRPTDVNQMMELTYGTDQYTWAELLYGLCISESTTATDKWGLLGYGGPQLLVTGVERAGRKVTISVVGDGQVFDYQRNLAVQKGTDMMNIGHEICEAFAKHHNR